MSDPIFPPEIEQIIFENALALKLKGLDDNGLNLLLVAKRFHTWLIPKVMETVVVLTARTKYKWEITSLEKYGKHTRNLLLWINLYHDQDCPAERYLTNCPNVTNLVLWVDYVDVPLKEAARLKIPLSQLSIDLEGVTEITPELTQLFSKITHLESLGTLDSETELAPLRQFTCLTHLSIPETSNQGLVPTLFSLLPSLQVLVLSLIGSRSCLMGPDGSFDPKSDDPRIVRMAWQSGKEVQEWLLDIQEGRGMWGLADEAVWERKRRKEDYEGNREK
ncbi:hypothetical protein BDN72DRAFT_964069 [Pluteus cervinus]|uniref:Uncharacterized protein n=1 Tax=Pluteus cervinus TaxID=181527 RepID=A0ACD3ABY8_9AGAR|nr:hypothetical protein BDN72DRAFT_964069 [Pluteus cervinus]